MVRMAVTDLTEVFSATKARSFLASIFETSNDPITGKSLDGTIQTWNAAAERIHGYTAQEAVGRPLSIIVPEDRTNEMHLIAERIRRGKGVEGLETVRVTKGGAHRCAIDNLSRPGCAGCRYRHVGNCATLLSAKERKWNWRHIASIWRRWSSCERLNWRSFPSLRHIRLVPSQRLAYVKTPFWIVRHTDPFSCRCLR